MSDGKGTARTRPGRSYRRIGPVLWHAFSRKSWWVRIGALTIAWGAMAHTPAGLDPATRPFFESLHRLDGGDSCCGALRDCFPVPFDRLRSPGMSPSGEWEVFIDKATYGGTAPDDWVVVPKRWVDDEPTTLPRPAQAIACWYGFAEYPTHPGKHLLCFRTPQPQG